MEIEIINPIIVILSAVRIIWSNSKIYNNGLSKNG